MGYLVYDVELDIIGCMHKMVFLWWLISVSIHVIGFIDILIENFCSRGSYTAKNIRSLFNFESCCLNSLHIIYTL